MIPNSVLYPFNFVNRRGIPLIESSNIEVTDSQINISIANRAFRFLDDRGIFLFRLNSNIESTSALPIVFNWTGFNQTYSQKLSVIGNENATSENISLAGVYVIYYDKATNLLQLVTIPQTTT